MDPQNKKTNKMQNESLADSGIRTLSGTEARSFFPTLLENGGSVPLVVTGSSMLPFLKNKRDTVWLRAEKKPKRGQILFFQRPDGSFVLHRVRKILSDGTIVVNGDAQSWCEQVSPERALAVVTAFSRSGKKAVPADSFFVRLRDILWYPTRPIRPFLFRVYLKLRRLFRKG